MAFTSPFREISKEDVALAGGKGASLGEMLQAGIPVPDGFVVLSTAFDRFLEETDIGVEIDSILHEVDSEKMHTVEDASARIQGLILGAGVPEDITKDIEAALSPLDSQFVAVRSSATAEDSATDAWAGQLDSFLNTPKAEVLTYVQKCWASLFTPRAIFYRFERFGDKTHTQKVSVAVVVQKMVASEKAGIAFSVHPVTEDYNQLIIEGGFGLGEAVVSGQVTPDSYVVEKEPHRILDTNVSEQSRALRRKEDGGNEWYELGSEGTKQVLTDKDVLELSALVQKIEKHYGFPCDIEWAYEGGKFYIVQSRPITTLSPQVDVADTPEVKSAGTPIKLGWGKSGREYEFHWSITGFEVLISDIILNPETYGGQDYVIIYDAESTMTRGYLTKRGVKETYDLSAQLFDKKRGDEVVEEFKGLDAKLRAYQPIPLTSENVAKAWEEYTRLWDTFCKTYRFGEQPYQQALEEALEKEVNTEEELVALLQNPKGSGRNTLSEKAAYALDLLHTLGEWKLQTHASMETLFEEGWKSFLAYLSEKYGISPDQGIFLRRDEFEKALTGVLPDTKIITERMKGFAFVQRDGQWECLTGKEYEELRQKVYASQPQEISGSVAFHGNVTGKVAMHTSWSEVTEIPEGCVLVTGMTNPQMIPYIKKAAAIVTDEGGMTCHAAIISRELKKPCIVGTKVATQLLADGDEVEVDANVGIVRIIKKAKYD